MRNLSNAAQTYIIGTVLVGIVGIIGYWTILDHLEFTNLFALILSCVLATLLQIFKIEGATARSSYNLSWVVYGATLAGLGPADMLVTVIVAHVGEWLWHRYPWYIQSFNIAAFALTSIITGLVYTALNALPFDFFGVRNPFAILVSVLVFTLVNHLMIGFVIKLARGQSLSQSGVFTLTTLTVDFGLLCLGASAAIVMQKNPTAIVFIVIVAYLVQSALRVPALERKSEQDSKTGLYNAQHFELAVQKELHKAQKQNRPLAVVMADLDKLRDLNNTYGHLAGDAVLKKIAQILQALSRDGDVVARFGGEEFGILLPDTTPEVAYIQVEAIRKAIEAAEFAVATSESPIKATMSFGIAGRTSTLQSVKEIVHNADVALYHSKHNGRNMVCAYRTEWEDAISPSAAEPAEVTTNGSVGALPAPALLAQKPIAATVALRSATTAEGVSENGESVPNPVQEAVSLPSDSERWIRWYIAAMAVAAIGLSSLVALFLPTHGLDLTGLIIFVLLAATLEIVATEIYSRDASVSTSVAITISAMMAFGIAGAVLSCLAVAFVTQFRNRKPINRFIFNVSNHVISSALCLLPAIFVPVPLLDWPMFAQIGFAIVSSLIVYLSSTFLLTGVLSLSTAQPFLPIWQERFKWLVLHYVALGAVAFVLFYSYETVGAFSVLILLVPLAMLHFSQHQYIKATKSMVEQLNEKNQILSNRNQEVQRLNDELLLALASTIDLRDPFVVEHSRHVARYAAIVAEELGLSPARVHLVYQAGLIHDIGKLAIPEAILFKPGRLTNDEYEVIKEHVTVGADLLDDFQSLQSVATFVRHHHERYDGRGYPDSLAGEDIPLEARILALADAVEAMASDRPYRPGSSVEAILKEIQHEAGKQFDPRVVEAFVTVVVREGNSTIINSARNIELPELKSNAALREEFASWTAPKAPQPNLGTLASPRIAPTTSA